jgi:hypothetical protein
MYYPFILSRKNVALLSLVLRFFPGFGLVLKQAPRLMGGSAISVLRNGLQIAGSERLLQEDPKDSIYES